MVISFATHLALLLAGDAAGPVVRIAQALAERLRGRGAAGSTLPALRIASIVVASPSGLLKQRLAGRVAGAGVIHAAAEDRLPRGDEAEPQFAAAEDSERDRERHEIIEQAE
jgi:hypothetical protein